MSALHLLRPQIHAAVVAVAALSEQIAQIVLAESRGGTRESCESATQAFLRRAQRDAFVRTIRAPEGIRSPDQWIAAVVAALEVKDAACTLAAQLPALWAEVGGEVERARVRLAAINARLAELEALIEGRQQQLGAYRVTTAGGAPVRAQAITRWRLGERFLWAFEFGLCLATFASFFGIDSLAASSVSLSTWLQIAAGAITVLIVNFGASRVAVPALRRFGMHRSLAAAGVMAAGCAVLALAGALAIVRLSGAVPAGGYSASIALYGAGALSVIGGLGGLGSGALATFCHLRDTQLTEEFNRIGASEAELLRPIEEAEAEIVRLEREHEDLAVLAQRPQVLASEFEGAVKVAERIARELADEREHLLTQALGAWRQLMSLTEADRESVAAEVMELRVVRRDEQGRGDFGAFLGTGVLLLGVLGNSGCGDPASPLSLTIACDPTGARPDDVCDAGNLDGVARAWVSPETLRAPGSRRRFVLSAGSYGDTRVSPWLKVPSTWGSDAKVGQAAFLQEAEEQIAAFPVVHDSEEGRSPNRSDLLSLVTVAAQVSTPGLGGHNRLVVMSDLRFRSLGFNAERQVPTSAEVLGRIEAEGMAWELSAFNEVTFCGVHREGLTAAAHAALVRLWGDLVAAGHGPAPTFLESCRDLVPATPSPAASPLVAALTAEGK